MLTIHPPEIIERDHETILQARIDCGDIHDVLWFSTPKEYGKYLCHERGDAFLIAMLPYAMKHGEDIHILAPLSDRLYYTLTKHFLKAVENFFHGHHRIKITCDTDARPLKNAGAVGTGLSCGIDSFCTIAEHTDSSCPPDYRLTHLTFFNVGASGDYGGYFARDLFQRRIAGVRPCADDLQLPLVTLDSNISEILDMDFDDTHTYRNVAAVLALQKLFRTYYYSSGSGLDQFSIEGPSTGSYDIYSLDMFSTETLKFFSAGEIYNRVEKTAIVSTHPLSYKYLNVCITGETNCSSCGKCQRTMLALDMLGKLDLYKGVFDLDQYRIHRSRYLGILLKERKKDHFQREIYDLIQRENLHIPLNAYVYRYLLVIFPHGVRHYPQLIKNTLRKLTTPDHR